MIHLRRDLKSCSPTRACSIARTPTRELELGHAGAVPTLSRAVVFARPYLHGDE